jgi:hypothetical protein
VPNKAVRWLQDFLTDHGVYVSWNHTTRITIRLEIAAKAEAFLEWSEEEIEKQEQQSEVFSTKLEEDPIFSASIKGQKATRTATLYDTLTPLPPPQLQVIPFRLANNSQLPPPPERATTTPFYPRTTSFD